MSKSTSATGLFSTQARRLQRLFQGGRKLRGARGQYAVACAADRTTIELLEGRLLLSVSQDATGATVVTPSAGATIVYVSSSSGSDANPGTASAPVATLAKAKSMLHNGSSDQMLLKRGDIWHEALSEWNLSGQSADAPIVLGAYGHGDTNGDGVDDRPEIATGSQSAFLATNGSLTSNIVVQGIHFYADQRDPSSPTYNDAADEDGFSVTNVDRMLIEDCQIDFYRNNIVVQGYLGATSNFTVRRSIVANSYSDEGTHSQGIYVQGSRGIVLDENVFDHNGWNTSVDGAGQTLYNHNAYIVGDNEDFIAQGNIFANASSHGLQARAGGEIIGNLFVNNPIDLSFGLVNGAGPLKPGGVHGDIKDNVFLGGGNIGSEPRGYALEMANTSAAYQTSVSGNVFAHGKADGRFAAINLRVGNNWNNGDQAVGLNNLSISNNVVYQWAKGLFVESGMQPGGTGKNALNNVTIANNDFQALYASNTIWQGTTLNRTQETLLGNRYDTSNGSTPFYLTGQSYGLAGWQSAAEATATAAVAHYSDPGRSLATFNASHGAQATDNAFFARALLQSASNYSAAYTGAAAASYIRYGFLDSSDPTPAIDASDPGPSPLTNPWPVNATPGGGPINVSYPPGPPPVNTGTNPNPVDATPEDPTRDNPAPVYTDPGTTPLPSSNNDDPTYGSHIVLNFAKPFTSQKLATVVQDGGTYDLSTLPTGATIVATTTAGGVLFSYDAIPVRVEVWDPLSLSGDIDGSLNPFALTTGTHTLSITRFATDSDAQAGLNPGPTYRLTFSITNGWDGTGGAGDAPSTDPATPVATNVATAGAIFGTGTSATRSAASAVVATGAAGSTSPAASTGSAASAVAAPTATPPVSGDTSLSTVPTTTPTATASSSGNDLPATIPDPLRAAPGHVFSWWA